MSNDRLTPVDPEPDASDVVEGPIGSAWLKDPSTPGSRGADLDALRPIDADPDDASDRDASIEGSDRMPERGLVGAD